VYLSGGHKPNADAAEFTNIAWADVVDAIEPLVLNSRGRYPGKSLAQLSDFLDTIKEEMHLTKETYTDSQRQKIELYGNYQEAIEEARTAFDTALEDEQDTWYERFPTEFRPANWSEDWHCSPTRSGQLYRDGWRLDENLELTDSNSDAVAALQFVHFLRNDQLVRTGD